jgi:hypothetical protein
MRLGAHDFSIDGMRLSVEWIRAADIPEFCLDDLRAIAWTYSNSAHGCYDKQYGHTVLVFQDVSFATRGEHLYRQNRTCISDDNRHAFWL